MKRKTNKKPDPSYGNSEFYFDDCLICRAVKASEEEGKSLSVEDLKEFFKLQNKKNNTS